MTSPLLLRVLLLQLCVPLALFAHDGEHDHEHGRVLTPQEIHHPSPLPDRIVLTWNGDPARSQAITWRTDTSVRRASAEVAPASDGPQRAARTVSAETTHFKTDLGAAHQHTVVLEDLEPDTLYAYRVGAGSNWSEWLHFRTAKDYVAPFTFVYFGDAQNDIRTHWSRVFREAFRSSPRAAFTLHAGDLVNRANSDAEWGEWFNAPAWVNGTIPVIAAPGNHEYAALGAGPNSERLWQLRSGETLPVTVDMITERDELDRVVGHRIVARAPDGRSTEIQLDANRKVRAVDDRFSEVTGWPAEEVVGTPIGQDPLRDRIAQPGVRTLSGHWRPQFTFPANGPAGLEETVYYLDYQGVRIISLNSNERQEEQVAWLRDVLQNNPHPWSIVTFHHPLFSPARNRDNPELRRLWKPILDEFRVDLVLTGHDHTYARSGDTTGRERVGTVNVPAGYNQVYDPAIGTVYVVSVSGPKMYDMTSDQWAVRSAEDTQLFQIISVDGRELRFEARTATNRLYDAFTLKKRPGQPNELIELLPPENRR